VLDILLGPNAQPLDVYMPRRGRSTGIGGSRAFKRKRIVPAGVFRIQQEFDAQYVLVPLSFMQELLEYRAGEISALELKLKPGANSARVIRDLEAILGEEFQVRNRYQINETVYRVMRTEKWAVYFVLTFILIVAAFNTIGSLSMLVLDKKKDIGTLRSLGGGQSLVQRVFLLEGLLQTGLSMTIGFVFALALLIGQIVFHWVKIPGAGTFVVDAYPVKLELMDFVLVFVTIVVIGTLAAWIPARRAASSRFTITSAK
jgi:lipoprotein-releasing system permease protein